MNQSNTDLSKKFSDEEILNLIAKSGAACEKKSVPGLLATSDKELSKFKASFYIPLAFILLGFCYFYLFYTPSHLAENTPTPPSNLSQKLQEKHQLINATSLEYLTVENALLELKDARVNHLKLAKEPLLALLNTHEEEPQENFQNKLNEAIWKYAEAELTEKELLSHSMEELYYKVSEHKKNDRHLFKLLVKETKLTPYLSDALKSELNPPDYLENFDLEKLHALWLGPTSLLDPPLESTEASSFASP